MQVLHTLHKNAVTTTTCVLECDAEPREAHGPPSGFCENVCGSALTINNSTKEEETGRMQKTIARARRWSCSNLGGLGRA